ncbi:phage GP46 family protein [Shewanella sp. D64]|uniref:phage GP46 family protein n=1 Tax=unclassified Shewanella TaxID=196818 RepID=UPI0022BA14C2|nr:MULTISPECIES: phage GP46 family protein [unclassified Shewanella]MEC4728165.1 phage GP46 family protein [Shewanella sp. D64]MEC4740285.1 phage GP46 family protein [Shewanella sp. E94]WBJ94400.1 phage GP46 family protein [Shewanella sp. MTB7]
MRQHQFTLGALTAPLTTIEGLTHAVLQSVLNHARSTSNDRARMENNERGGCWHEVYVPAIGSRDWTLSREKLTEQTVIRAKSFIDDALQWLVDEGHIMSFSVEVKRLSGTAISRVVTVNMNDATSLEIPL